MSVNTLRIVTPNMDPMVMKCHRYPADVYEAAMEKATERRENLSAVLRAALEAYVKGDEK